MKHADHHPVSPWIGPPFPPAYFSFDQFHTLTQHEEIEGYRGHPAWYFGTDGRWHRIQRD
jgi:hypothetical protein